MGRRAGIYVRISQDRDGEGAGVARQEADARALADRQGWEVAEVYRDNDVSASTGATRPAYERLLADLEIGEIDAVVAWHPDRLHRSPVELERFIGLVERTGSDVATVTAGDLDLGSSTGRMTARIVGAVARGEVERNAERIRRKHRELAEAGKLAGGGRRPFGYERDRVTIREDEAVHVRDAAARLLRGESLRSVIVDWQERGVETVSGAVWSATTLKRLLRSARISGRREHHGEIVGEAVWPGIISPDDSDRLRSILDAKRGHRGGRGRSYLLSNIARCGACGSGMIGKPAGKRRRYACPATDRGGCGRVGIDARLLDGYLVEAVMVALEGGGLAAAFDEREADAAADLTRQLADVEDRQAELAADYYEHRRISRAAFLGAHDALQADSERLRSELAGHQRSAGAIDAVEGPLRPQWDDLPLERQTAIIAAVIDSVTVAPVERHANTFDPDRLAISWRA